MVEMGKLKGKSVRQSNAKTKSIIIDESKNLVFESEDQLLQHFAPDIEKLEKEFFDLRSSADFDESEMEAFEGQLEETLESPDEVWLDKTTLENQEIAVYIKEFDGVGQEDSVFHVAITYLTDSVPTFVYLHFPTKYLSLVEKYQRGERTFDRIMQEAPLGAVEGDALLEGDELALGMFEAMLKVRSESDIPEEQFRSYSQFREQAIEEADEIWRTNDSFGNTIVNFVKDTSDEEQKELYYVVVTIEDSATNTHALLFSFPTRDKNLVTRYRQGENLQADEVVQESSH